MSPSAKSGSKSKMGRKNIVNVILAFACLHLLMLSKSSLQLDSGNATTLISLKELDDIALQSAPESEKEWTFLAKKIVASRLGVLEHFSPKESVKLKRIDNTSISLVISHCEGDVSWIPFFMKEKKYNIKDVTIYSKCSNDVKGIDKLFNLAPTKIVEMVNVGRNDHTYANYINEHYEQFKKEKDAENDMIFFMKDSNYFFGKNLPYNNMDEMFENTFESGFSCLAKPTCDCNTDCNLGKDDPTMMHDAEFLFEFSIDKYSRAKRDMNDDFISKKYPNLKSWYKDIGFRTFQSKTIPVCYTGMFATRRREIFNQPKSVWDKMAETLTRGDNIIESHYAERTWANVLSNNDDRIALQIDRSLLSRVKKMVGKTTDGTRAGGTCGMQGMLYVDAYLPKVEKKYSGSLRENDVWSSLDGSHYLTYKGKGELIFYKKLEGGSLLTVWKSKSNGWGGYATLHDSGELDIVDKKGVQVYTNNLSGLTGAYIQFDNGSFHIFDGNNEIVQSFPPLVIATEK